MTIAELTVLIGPMGFLLALYGAIRGELLRRQNRNEEQQKDIQQLKNDMEIMKIRLAPLLEVMNKRLVGMFHEANDTWRVDVLAEKYEANPDSLTEAELERLIHGIYITLQRVKKGGPNEDPSKALAAALTLALLDGERDAKRLSQYPPPIAGQPPEALSWWTRLWQWLGQ